MKREMIVVVALAAACARKTEMGDTTGRAADTAATPSPSVAPAADSSSAPRRPDSLPPSSSKSEPSVKTAPPAVTPPATKSPGAPATDTIRGIAAVVGTERDRHTIIRPAGGRAVTLEGPQATLVGRASGAEVWVAGTPGERGALTVTEFAVRMVDGIVALDGTLATDGDRLVLVTPDSKRHPIAHPPDALRQHVGGRVWISGNLDQGPVAYGIIQDKP